MLTTDQLDKYVAEGGITCPYCGEANSVVTDAGSSDSSHATIYSDVSCRACEKHWTEAYNLATIIEDEE